MGQLIGIAEIEAKLTVTNRGIYLRLRDGWEGTVKAGGTLRRGHREARILGVEAGHGRHEGKVFGFIAVLIDDQELAADMRSGDSMEFFDS